MARELCHTFKTFRRYLTCYSLQINMLRRDTIRTYSSQNSVLVNTTIVLLHAAKTLFIVYQTNPIYIKRITSISPSNQSKMRCWNTYKLLSNNDAYKYIKSLKPVEPLKKPTRQREREFKRERVDFFLGLAYGRRVSERDVAGTLRSSAEVILLPLLRILFLTVLSELWSSLHLSSSTRGVNRHQWWHCVWSNDAIVWRVWCGGGFYNSVAAGLVSRRWRLLQLCYRQLLTPGGEGFPCLGSPTFGSLVPF
ncbi:hypothetical protein YC2023_085809 [Brassica napus]